MCKEKNWNCFKFVVWCGIVCLVVATITIFTSIFVIAPLIAKNCIAIAPATLFIVALCVVLISSYSLICITIIAVSQMKITSEAQSQNLNEEILTKLIECALNKFYTYESPKSAVCLHKVSGKIKLNKLHAVGSPLSIQDIHSFSRYQSVITTPR